MNGLLKVLVIEDNPDDAELMVRALRRHGFELDWQRVEAKDDFLRALDRRPDLILSDYNLPAWTGLDAFEALREAGCDIPFILVTGALGDEAAVECLKRGMADYVLKENLRRLPLAVRRALDAHQAQLERGRAEETLKALARGTAQVTGEAFFPALVENLARALGVRWALVGRLCGEEHETVETLALWDGDHLADNIMYELAGAPCEDVIRQGLCVHTEGVQAKFPQDTLLREMGAECYMGAPLHLADGGVVGLLAVLDERPYRPPPGVEEVFQVFAARAAAELERLQKIAALEEAAQEWRRTFDTMSDMVTIHDSEFRIVRANRAAARAFGLDPEDMIGRECYQVFHQRDRPVENCPLHRALRSGELETLELWEPTIDKHLLVTTNPMRDAEGRLIGVVHVARDITARKRTEATWRALNAAAAALQRAGLTEPEIYGTATEQLTALGLQGAIILFDEAADSFTFEHVFLPGRLLAAVERLTGITPAGFRFPRGRVPAYDQVVESRQAIFVTDRFDQIVTKLLPESVGRLAGQLAKMIDPASAILAPLRMRNRVTGVLYVASEWVTEADMPAITAFADQLSAALENARLYQAALQAAERRSILYWASQEITRVVGDPEQVYQAVHQAAAQLMPCEAFVIALADEPRQAVTAVYLVDQGGRWPAQRIPAGRGLSGQVLASGEPLLIDDFSPTGSGIDAVQFGDPEHVRSILAVPMRLGERIIGAISAQSYQPHAYTTDDQHLLEMLAAHAAVALESARLFDETRRRAEETTALLTTAQAITSLNLEAVLETIASQAKTLFQADGGRIHLIEPDGETLRCAVALHDRAEAVMAVRLKLGQGFTGRVALNGEPELIPNTLADSQHIQVPGTPVEPEAVALSPLKAGQRVIGVMTVTRLGEDRPFNRSDLEMLTAFASQAAVAIENARLFGQMKLRAQQLTLVSEIASRAVAVLDPDALLWETAEAIQTAFGYPDVLIFLVDHEHQQLIRKAWAGHYQRREITNEAKPIEERGIIDWVATRGETVLANDVRRDWRYVPLFERTAAELCVPLRDGETIIGGINVESEQMHAFDQSDVLAMEALADTLVVALRNARLYAETRQHVQRLTAIRNIDRAISASLDLNVVLNVLLAQITSQPGVDAADVLLFRSQTQTLEYAAGRGFRMAALQRTRLRLGEGLAGQAALEQQTVSISDFGSQIADFESGRPENSNLKSEGFTAYYAVPLISKGEVQGVLEIYQREPKVHDPHWLEFLEAVAAQAAIAIDNAALLDQAKRAHLELALAYDVTLEGWARALELRDAETEGHTQRVTEMALRLARAMGLNGSTLAHVRRGALLHDIGKLGIPDSVLLKPDELDDEEWDIIRLHPVYAHELLSPIAYLRPALDIPYCHHERWDGTGYPRGLKGGQIPLPARIFAVVDVYDALRSDRPYRPAWSEEEVRAYIREQAGAHFDPEVVEAFMKILEE